MALRRDGTLVPIEWGTVERLRPALHNVDVALNLDSVDPPPVAVPVWAFPFVAVDRLRLMVCMNVADHQRLGELRPVGTKALNDLLDGSRMHLMGIDRRCIGAHCPSTLAEQRLEWSAIANELRPQPLGHEPDAYMRRECLSTHVRASAVLPASALSLSAGRGRGPELQRSLRAIASRRR